jgi:hypothetical protein
MATRTSSSKRPSSTSSSSSMFSDADTIVTVEQNDGAHRPHLEIIDSQHFLGSPGRRHIRFEDGDEQKPSGMNKALTPTFEQRLQNHKSAWQASRWEKGEMPSVPVRRTRSAGDNSPSKCWVLRSFEKLVQTRKEAKAAKLAAKVHEELCCSDVWASQSTAQIFRDARMNISSGDGGIIDMY